MLTLAHTKKGKKKSINKQVTDVKHLAIYAAVKLLETSVTFSLSLMFIFIKKRDII